MSMICLLYTSTVHGIWILPSVLSSCLTRLPHPAKPQWLQEEIAQKGGVGVDHWSGSSQKP